ncbi:MAG: glycosyltransferase [Chloroflexi bacterium]|nr:glycosyltransferase [Chloroflexota bacterium]
MTSANESPLGADKARPIELSIVMPAYNEEGRIGPTLREYVEHFRRLYNDAFEIVVVLNGCVDDTRGVVEAEAQAAPEIRIIEFQQPMGKGGAIWEGLAVAHGEKVGFVDADNMVRAPEAEKLIRALDSADIAIANRFAGAEEDGRSQPPLRKLISQGSRLWVRYFLGLPYSDTQCGAKAFRTAAWRLIAPKVRERGWAFDLDVLAQARQLDLKVAEVPVRWKHIVEGSKVRPWKDVPQTLWATLSIRRRVHRD